MGVGGESLLAWLQVVILPWQEEENSRKCPSALLLKYDSNFSTATRGDVCSCFASKSLPFSGMFSFQLGICVYLVTSRSRAETERGSEHRRLHARVSEPFHSLSLSPLPTPSGSCYFLHPVQVFGFFFFFWRGGLCTKPYPYSSRGSHLYLCICVRIYMQSRHDLNQWSQTLFPELFLPKDLSANHKHLIVALRSSRSTKTGVRFWFLDETCRKLDPEEEAYCQPTFNLNPSTGFSTSCPIT